MPFTTTNGHRIHYVDTQALEYQIDHVKLPIIMIHGLGSSQNYYMPIVPELEGHRCVALTTYGAAESKSNGEDLTLEQLAEDVVGVMDNLGIRKAIVVGHSMGGTMCCTIAAAHGDRVAGIVCIGPVNPASVKPEMFQTRIETVLKGELVEFHLSCCAFTDFPWNDSEGMDPMANTVPKAATNANSTPLQRAMIRELIIGQDPKSYASHCRVILEMKEPSFASTRLPALILAGDEDKSAPLEGCQYILDHLGSEHKELKVMPNVGHWHCIEAPERVGKEIAAFAKHLTAWELYQAEMASPFG